MSGFPAYGSASPGVDQGRLYWSPVGVVGLGTSMMHVFRFLSSDLLPAPKRDQRLSDRVQLKDGHRVGGMAQSRMMEPIT